MINSKLDETSSPIRKTKGKIIIIPENCPLANSPKIINIEPIIIKSTPINIKNIDRFTVDHLEKCLYLSKKIVHFEELWHLIPIPL